MICESHLHENKQLPKLFIRGRKLFISLVFITQSYFRIPNDIRINCTHYLLMEITNRKELQNIATDHSCEIDYADSLKLYRKQQEKSTTH